MKWKIVFVLVCIYFCVVTIAKAENSGVSLSPPFLDVELKESDNEYQYELAVENKTKSIITFEMSVVDFGSLDDSGGVAFLTTNSDKDTKKYALASWISLEKSEITIDPGSKQLLKINILNKDSLSPGGHYGAILATMRSGEIKKGDLVSINQSLASLLYVQKTGGEIKNLILKNIEWKNNGLFLVNKMVMRFENNGNVHLVPRGLIEIKNGKGELFGKGIINDASARILPESYRKILVDINPLGRWRLPGKYFMEIKYRFDGKTDFINYKTSFIYIGIEGVIIFSTMVALVSVVIWKKKK